MPRLSPQQIEAMELFRDLGMSDEFRLDMEFRRGDTQFLNNHAIIHSRTGYEDHTDQERRRHLLRMLLFTPAFADVPEATGKMHNFIRAWGEHPRESALAAGE